MFLILCAFQRITVIDLFLSQIFEDKYEEERLFCGELLHDILLETVGWSSKVEFSFSKGGLGALGGVLSTGSTSTCESEET